MSVADFLFAGVFDLPWWGLVLVALALTHVTIAAVTIYLHRQRIAPSTCTAAGALLPVLAVGHDRDDHQGVGGHPPQAPRQVRDARRPAQPTGVRDQPRPLGRRVPVRERGLQRETLERYGRGTPDDWMERNVYSRLTLTGLTLTGLLNVALFGLIPGVLILVVQIAWIPFWAAGVINGIGHYWGYRSWETGDASRNIVPFGILIGGEELHNNHHAYATSAQLSNKWYEIDVGWWYIRILESLGLARVKKLAPRPRLAAAKPVVDLETVQAVIANRYDVLARYAKSLKQTYAEEVGKLKRFSPRDAEVLRGIRRWLHRDERVLPERERATLAEALAKSKALETAHSMRRELAAVWERSSASENNSSASSRTGATAPGAERDRAAARLLDQVAVLRVSR